MSSELESASLFEPLSIWNLLIPRSLDPIDGALASTALTGGFNNLRRKWTQVSESSK
uniref:Uncharacterized protein n=1 Tax=Arundo donax TaxID=35708 RepID=A0A0A9CN80_ARUDO